MKVAIPSPWTTSRRKAPSLRERFVDTLSFIAYKLVVVVLMAGSGLDGGVIEESSDNVKELLKDNLLSCSTLARPLAPGRARVHHGGRLENRTADAMRLLATHAPLSRHTNHSLPNGLRAPSLC